MHSQLFYIHYICIGYFPDTATTVLADRTEFLSSFQSVDLGQILYLNIKLHHNYQKIYTYCFGR